MSKARNLLFLGLVFCSLSGLTTPRVVYLSKVTKNSVAKYLNRFVTNDSQIVVTQELVPGALIAKRILLQDDEPIYFFESRHVKSDNCVENICWSKKNEHLDGAYLLGSLGQDEIESTSVVLNLNFDFPASLRSFDISQEFLKEKLMILSGEKEFNGKLISERQTPASKKLAREFLKKEFTALGYNVVEQNFDGGGESGVNLIAEKTGKTSKYWVVSAHYDSMKTAGADDDATGIITLLAVGAQLANRELETGVKFVAFDLEERGMLGSEAFITEISKNNKLLDVMGDIQLEMTGYDSDGDGHMHIIDCNENSSNQITKLIEKVISQEGLSLKKIAACTNRSDHSVFWERGLPAIVMSENFFGGDGNPCYHRACDKVKLIDFNYMRMISVSIAETVLALVSQ